MLVAGLTGGIATGKSTVAGFFKELGAVIIDADQIAHRLVEPGLPAWQKIVDYFGPEVLSADNQLKRKYIADRIFDSDQKRWAVNAIIHPLVIRQIEQQLKELAETSPQATVIADIPLLFEVEWPFAWDRILVVTAARHKQFERLLAREGRLSQMNFRKRLRSQMPLAEKIQRADWVIDTNSSPEQTKEQVRDIYQQLLLITDGTTR
ncbi:MAG: dephospho-CoA kinase [Candidatus Schekmanbacteria bacterium]|nr:dephospho-CoA kinase [Candidatus Schekmanbacteria bacterium]